MDSPIERIPMFVLAGGIVPMGPLVQHLTETITLFASPGADGQFDLYEDDGETNNYREGRFCVTAR